MELLEYIAYCRLDYKPLAFLPVTKKQILKELNMNNKTYKNEIRKLKKEGLIKIKIEWLPKVIEHEYINGLVCVGWTLTDNGLNHDRVKRVENELIEMLNRRMTGRFLW